MSLPIRLALLSLASALAGAPAIAQTLAPAPAIAPDLAVAIDRDPAELEPGEFLWAPEVAPEGPVVMVISLPEQRAYVYRNGLRIAVSTISTGKEGHETPTGVFAILQKKKEYHSSLYNDAPMPYMQRLTWDGVALHAGRLPGYPASHGCVRLPYEFSKRLFEITNFGMTVVVADDRSQAPEVAHPGVFAPVDPTASARSMLVPRLSWYRDYRWTPERAPEGPLSILLSSADHRVLILRNGIEIGRAKIGLVGPAPLGTYLYVLMAGVRAEPSRLAPGHPALNWLALGLPGQTGGERTPQALDPQLASRIVIPAHFADAVYDALKPGTTVLVTDEPVLSRSTDGQRVTVLATEDAATYPLDDEAVEGDD